MLFSEPTCFRLFFTYSLAAVSKATTGDLIGIHSICEQTGDTGLEWLELGDSQMKLSNIQDCELGKS